MLPDESHRAEAGLVKTFLEADRDEYLSGEALSQRLGVTRAALWKRLNALRAQGFSFDAQRGKGYRLSGLPDLSSIELMARVRGPVGSTVYLYDSLSSTNDRAMAMASEGAPSGTVVIADFQSGGRGRLGRAWVSPPGKNLYLSVILRPDIEPRRAGMLPLLCAVAASEGIEAATGFSPLIKWPNDIQAKGRKLGGILCEMRTEPGRVLHAVAGLGINVNAAEKDFPRDLRDTATSLYLETREKHRRTPVAAGLLDALSVWMERFLTESAKPVADAWRVRSSTLGQKVRVHTPAGVVTGKARDIDDEGSLMLEMKDGSLRSVSTGDVELLR